MKRLVGLAGAALALTLVGAFARPADAKPEPMTGVVVSVMPNERRAVVRHDAFGGMPAMTMDFAIRPAADLRKLAVGDRIAADADFAPDVPLLEHVRVTGTMEGASVRVVHDVQALHVGDSVPLTNFFDQNGQAFTINDFRNDTVVLAFIYTRCRDPRMCPLVSANFHALQRRLAGLPVHLIEITLDPTYDTPKVLAAYAQRFDADSTMWSLGTGPADVVNHFAAQFGIAVFADPTAGLIHSERTAIVNGNGVIVDLLDAAAWNPDDVAAEVRSLAGVPSNPIARLDYELSKFSAALCGNDVPGYSGLLDLCAVLGIFTGASVLLWFIYRKIFVENA